MNLLKKILDQYPHRTLYNVDSPIQRLDRLEKVLNTGVRIFIKRDDELRPFFGNKMRYIEYVLGQYDDAGADCLVHSGGLTSNYMAQLAMTGAIEGIPVHLILTGEKPGTVTGNYLLQKLCGAHVYFSENIRANTNSKDKSSLGRDLAEKGHKPYIVDYPWSNYSAYLGYMRCFEELHRQSNDIGKFDRIFLCSGWHSYLGLKAGAQILKSDIKITAFRQSYWKDGGLSIEYPEFSLFLKEKINEINDFLDIDIPFSSMDVRETMVGKGYGITDSQTLSAIRLLASNQSIFLDPIYSGKAFAGVIRAIQDGEVKPGESVLFIHTGGSTNIFGYTDEMTRYFETQQIKNEGLAYDNR